MIVPVEARNSDIRAKKGGNTRANQLPSFYWDGGFFYIFLKRRRKNETYFDKARKSESFPWANVTLKKTSVGN
jgi:hypothetical protein